MNLDSFINKYRSELILMLKAYCNGAISHDEAAKTSWEIIEGWEQVSCDSSTPYAEGENVFWATVWATQHLADSEHWNEGVTQRELSHYLALLSTGRDLTGGEFGYRPGTT